MIDWFIKWNIKHLKKYKPRRYGISPNGSTIYSLDPEGARRRAMELAKKHYEWHKKGLI